MGASEQPSFISLSRQSRQVATALESTHQRLEAMEDALSDFLNDYYAKVGDAFEELTRLRSELDAVRRGCFGGPSAQRSAAPTASKAESIRSFYHSMARECHPDAVTASTPDAAALKAEMMKTLNAAYARKNLSEMWKLKWQLEQQKHDGRLSHGKRLELLLEQQSHLQQTLSELEQREDELHRSDAWQLMQHARLMQACGQDFAAMVKGRVQAQLAETKRELRAAKHQAKYWGHVTMQRAEKSL